MAVVFTRAAIQVGVGPMLQGVFLWIVVATISLWLISAGWISLLGLRPRPIKI